MRNSAARRLLWRKWAISVAVNAISREPMAIDRSWEVPSNPMNRFCRSDQVYYVLKEIPTAYFSLGYAQDYHQLPDEPQYVDYAGLARVTRFIHDVALARAILTVPINPEFGSLNLAQAVIVCAYEWSKSAQLAVPTAEDLLPPAPQAELDGMIAQLEAMLEPAGYFLPPSRSAATRRTLRTMLTKPGWNHLEVRTLRGVLSALRRNRDG